MNFLAKDAIVARLTRLPALPTIVCDLLASFNQEELDVGQLSRQIAKDQALTACLLRIANSSFYGLQCRVATINDAVVLVGYRAVRSMVLAVSVNSVFRADQCPGFDPQGYIRHSIGTGLGARALAVLSDRNPELAFTAGILHDIGELALASCFADQYAGALAYRQQHDCSLVVAERDVLGIDHAAVGGLLAELWHFPSSLQSAVVNHHSPAAATADSLADIIHISDAIAHGLGLARIAGEMVLPVDPTAWQRLRLNDTKIAAVLQQVVASMDEACVAFSG